MDVYLVPLGVDRYELYCELSDTPEEVESGSPDTSPPGKSNDPLTAAMRWVRGFFQRMAQRFRDMLAEAERNRLQPQESPAEAGWAGRLKVRMMRWVAESIAEQRLLWHLRRQQSAVLHHPDDMAEVRALALMRHQLGRDFERHRFWLIIDSVGFVASGLFVLIPGPNVIAYYFAFRAVGHYLSMRGARQGLRVISWKAEQSAPLTALRQAIGLAPDIRLRRVHEVADSLHLAHLARFFERAVVPSS
ncbi:MAG TPA: hypothetical protein VLD67_21410 [Vicinamibacterales bacterium]|nr:hypothetical protein [Vicinamibacterales bacterium]